MGKRSDFPKHERDYYSTPLDPIRHIVPYLLGQSYAEPCVGGGDLVYGINHLTFRLGDNRPRCLWASDIQPDTANLARNAPYLNVRRMRAEKLTHKHLAGIDTIVTNPPFSWHVLS